MRQIELFQMRGFIWGGVLQFLLIQVMKFVRSLTFAGILVAGLATTSSKGDPILTTLLSFTVTNGANPSAELVQGADGNFYGTTVSGGANGYGTVFRMTSWGLLTNLVSFANTNGAGPRAGLARGADGDFLGVAYSGGAGNFGTIFKLSALDAFTTLFSFTFANGAYPIARLELGQDGNFYGTTAIGGSNSAGTVFRFNTNGMLTPLVSFGYSGTNGDSPYANLIQTKDGSFYGSTFQGGNNGNGTLFKMTTNGTLVTLHSFTGTNDGANPYAGLVQGGDGILYGTTFSGGAGGFGTIFKLTTNGVFSTLFSFRNTNGANPKASLIQLGDGSLYGATTSGGAYTNQAGEGYGTIFKVATNGTFSTLLSFNNTNGANPQAALVLGTDASLYGTTANGGASGNGTVFRLNIASPPPPVFRSVAQTGNSLTLAWSALVGQMYQIQYKTNLVQTDWSNLGNAVIATNATATLPDDIVPDNQRFYRAVLLR